QRTIEIPGVGNAALAASRLIRRQTGFQRWIVEPLHLPRDDSILHEDLPRAAACAVHTMRAADDLVVLPPISVELLPRAQFRPDLVFDPGQDSVSVAIRLHRTALLEFSTNARRTL